MKALGAYAAHCQRQGPAKVWASHISIWNEPVGELSVPVPAEEWQAMSVFAALVPFMVVPTIGESWLVVDRSNFAVRHLCVVRLFVEYGSMDIDAWAVGHTVADDGSMSFGEPVEGVSLPQNSIDALVQVAEGRANRVGWSDEIDFSRAVKIAEGMLP